MGGREERRSKEDGRERAWGEREQEVVGKNEKVLGTSKETEVGE